MRYLWKIVATVLVAAFLWFVWPTRWEYYSNVTGSNIPHRSESVEMHRVDRITGDVWYWGDKGWMLNK